MVHSPDTRNGCQLSLIHIRIPFLAIVFYFYRTTFLACTAILFANSCKSLYMLQIDIYQHSGRYRSHAMARFMVFDPSNFCA